MRLGEKVTGSRRLKWPKNPQYGEAIKKASWDAGLQRKDLATGSKKVSESNIKRAWAGEHISHSAHVQILAKINQARGNKIPRVEIEYPWPVDGPTERENWDTEKIFQGHARLTNYKVSAQLAEETFKRCRKAKQFLAAAHWADHAAGEYRKQGCLRSALGCLEDCFRAMRKVKEPERSSVEMKLLSMRARFERAMTHEYKVLGEFPKAFNSFKSFDADVDVLMGLEIPEKFRGELSLRKIHNKRQQAEMLRLSGHYSEASLLLKEAFAEYPEWADEARRQTELHQADALRLLGNPKDALAIYERLEITARNRQQDGLLAAVLWPMIGAIQTLKDMPVRQSKIKIALNNIMNLAGNDFTQNRYLFIYSRLVSVSENVKNTEMAIDLVNQAFKAGPLEPDCFRTEYAHANLCCAEIERYRGDAAAARQFYNEALHYYRLMEMRWGIVRSTIGLNLLGEHQRLPTNLCIEGVDRAIWSHFEKNLDFTTGILCENIP